jgi:hypothetical protein
VSVGTPTEMPVNGYGDPAGKTIVAPPQMLSTNPSSTSMQSSPTTDGESVVTPGRIVVDEFSPATCSSKNRV